LRGPVDFDFPTNTVLAPGASLLLTSFAPSNAAQLGAFFARWNFSAATPVFGPWTGRLQNDGGNVQIQRPDTPNADGTVPYILVDRVEYSDVAPWPAAADGYGAALDRLSLTEYGNDPINWVPRAPWGAAVPDSDADGMADWWEIATGLNPLTGDAELDPDGDGQNNGLEFLSRTDPHDAASVFRLNAERLSATALVVRFEAMAGVPYTLQTNGALEPANWGPLLQIPGAQTNRWISLTNSLVTPQTRFYRVTTPPVY
jgi:hypothetical protein